MPGFGITTSEKILCSLLRLSLGFGENPEIVSMIRKGETEWDHILALSGKHGVTALVYNGLIKLPKELQPDRMLLIKWGIITEQVRARYDYYRKVAKSLVSFFNHADIKVLHLKGTGLAGYYPEPYFREGGDIDIFLFGAYEKGNRLITEKGIPVNTSNPKHSCFIFHQIFIENHHHFLNSNNHRSDRILEPVLLNLLEQMAPLERDEFTGAYLPPPDFNAFFLLKHALNHIPGGDTTLRHLCDWACFLSACSSLVDYSRYREILTSAGIMHLADAFTALAVDYIGLPEDKALPFERNKPTEQKLSYKIFTFHEIPANKSTWNILRFKYHRLMDLRNSYTLIYNEHYARHFMRRLIHHFSNPKNILKLK